MLKMNKLQEMLSFLSSLGTGNKASLVPLSAGPGQVGAFTGPGPFSGTLPSPVPAEPGTSSCQAGAGEAISPQHVPAEISAISPQCGPALDHMAEARGGLVAHTESGPVPGIERSRGQSPAMGLILTQPPGQPEKSITTIASATTRQESHEHLQAPGEILPLSVHR